MGIKFTIEYGMKKTDFLDVMFDLTRGNRKPYMKPNNEIKYVNVGSNHPKCIIEQLPKMISNRLSKISSGELEFNEEKPAYEEALKKSGYKSTNLEFEDIKNREKKGKGRCYGLIHRFQKEFQLI